MSGGFCRTCRHFGLCAPDCTLAPWNFEPATYPAPSAFAYLLRQRRWAGSPVDRRDARFWDPRLAEAQHRAF